MRTYEIMFISAPTTAEDDLSKLTSQLENVVGEKGGKIAKIDTWGRRKLAYRINKFDEGIYTLLFIEGTGQEISEVERRLRVTDFVIRHLSIRTDEDLKRAEKMKAKRKSAISSRSSSDDDDFDLDLEIEAEEDLGDGRGRS
ncbi:MAG: 30S ribosomal protein S6 [Acidobacteria bacterium]|nr:30S ribosomal protein S6 [Acidobacteriota bacterium]